MSTHPSAPHLHAVSAGDYACLDFRREKLADPKQLSTTAHTHLQHCSACQQFNQRTDQHERALLEVLSVPLPEGLNDRIILRARRHKPTSPHSSRWWIALAASLFVAALTFQHYGLPGSNTHALALAAAAHVLENTDEARTHISEPIEKFAPILAKFGGTLKAPIGKIQYIHECPVGHMGRGWHITYQSPQGPLTLLLVPGSRSGPDAQRLQVEGQEVLLRRAGQGYYAIVGTQAAPVDAADRDLQARIQWQI